MKLKKRIFTLIEGEAGKQPGLVMIPADSFFPILVKDIHKTTELRQQACETLPVIPGQPHISKALIPLAPNIVAWNYIIQVGDHYFSVRS